MIRNEHSVLQLKKRYLLLEQYVDVVIPFLTKSVQYSVARSQKPSQQLQAKFMATLGRITATKFSPLATFF